MRRSASTSSVLACTVSNAPGSRLSTSPGWSCILGGLALLLLVFRLIPSVTERSDLFQKELSFPHTPPTDDAFFFTGLDWSGLQSLDRNWNCRWASPLALDGGLLCKNKKEGGSARASPVAAPMPKSVPP